MDTLLNNPLDPLVIPSDGGSNIAQSPQLIAEGPKSPLDNDRDNLFTFSTAFVTLKQLISQWTGEVNLTEGRRKERDIAINVDALRESGDIKEDETFIPVRIIDTNIKREQPAYVNYLRNSRRLAIFTCLSNPGIDTQTLEQEFTKGMTYPEWEKPHFKEIDGAQTHGWDTIEVVFNKDNPLHVGLEHVGHDKLFFSWDAISLQNCGRVLRAFDLTIQQLQSFVNSFGFDQQQVSLLIADRKDAGIKEEMTIRIYKCFYKFQGIVYIAWFAAEMGTSDWLKAPTKLFLGRKKKVTVMVDVPNPLLQEIGAMGIPPMAAASLIPPTIQQPQEQWQDIDETSYPLFTLPYQETEKPRITDHRGRCFLDSGKQEAHTAVLTGFVNGITRASNIYGAPTQDTADGAPMKLADVKLVNGAVVNRPFTFWHPDYPDPMVIRALQYMDTNNSQEVGDTNFATLNRQDSRKTATELNQAQQEATKLDSVQLTLFSTHIRLMYGFVWLIVQSQAQQELLPYFLLKEDPQTMKWAQDQETIEQVYDIRAAGDVDVVQKAELVSQMKQDWPVISQTALANEFLIDLIKLEYPNDAARYEAILRQKDPMSQILAGANAALNELVTPAEVAKLPPDRQAQLQGLLMEIQSVLGGMNPAMAMQQAQKAVQGNGQQQQNQSEQQGAPAQ